jgi:hypothetical protein
VLRRELRELKEQGKAISAQVQGLATAMQLMATQMAALASTTRMRLETLAAASTTMTRTRPADEPIAVEIGRPIAPPAV